MEFVVNKSHKKIIFRENSNNKRLVKLNVNNRVININLFSGTRSLENNKINDLEDVDCINILYNEKLNLYLTEDGMCIDNLPSLYCSLGSKLEKIKRSR